MNLTNCKKFNITTPFIIGVGVLVASAFLSVFVAFAQTDVNHEAQVQAAFQDLGSAIGQNITSEDQARDFCNQEQYLDLCADIGKKHNLYTEEETKQVDAFLNEVKGKILEDIKTCPDEECLVRVAGELAQKIKTKNPALADNFKLTSTIVEEKRAVIEAAKEAGVNFRDCEAMDPDTAPIDLLRKCARLAKDSRVQKYIPEEKRVLAEQFEDSATVKLREALAAGRYQCGDNTLEGCGNYCLNPGSSTGGIPPVCSQIASEIFGEEGVKQLEAAHQQVGQVQDYYAKKFILILPDGRELVREGQIRNACDKAFSDKDLSIAKACGAFAVKNGFAKPEDVEKGLKIMEQFANKGADIKFEQCITNPESCREFIPENERERFDVGNRIFQIMKEEMGFEPFQCERGRVDETIGKKCFEGSKRALAKIESLGLVNQSQEARFIVEDIKRHVAEGENLTKQKDQFREVFQQQGGPGGCKSEAECFSYCSDSANGPECIAFGSRQGISGFRGEEAIHRFQEYNQNIQRPDLADDRGFLPSGRQFPQYPGQDPRFTQPGPGFSPPPGIAPYYPPFPGGPGPVGSSPSPECFAAIQSGDFVKAKTVCYVPYPPQPFPKPQICPATPYIECPAGQYRESFRNEDGCWVDGSCKPAPTYSSGPYPTYTQYPGDQNSCPWFAYSRWDNNGKRYCRLNELDSCQYNYPAYLDKASYSLANCPIGDPIYSPYPTSSPGGKPQCSDGIDNDKDGKTDYPADSSCYGPDDWDEYYPPDGVPSYTPGPGGWLNKTWKFKDGSTQYSSILNRTDSEYTTFINGIYNDCLDKYFNGWKPGGGNDNNWQEFGIPVCSSVASTPGYSPYPTYSPGPSSCSQSLINLLGTGCHQMYSDSSGRSIYCDGPMTKSAKEGDTATIAGCTSPGGTYTPYPTSSPGGKPQCSDGLDNDNDGQTDYPTDSSCYGLDDWDEYYPTPGTSPGASPYPTYSPPVSGQCPSFAHVMYGTNGSVSYCMLNSDTSKCAPLGTTSESAYGSCSVFQTSPSYSPSPTSSPTSGGTCPAGSHIMYVNNAGGYCMSDSDLSKCGPLNSSSVSSFGSCSSYQTTATYTPPPSCPSGQWWDYATNSCKSSTTTGNCAITSYNTSSSGICNYSTCPSGCNWENSCPVSCYSGSTTYTPYPTFYSPAYTPTPTFPTYSAPPSCPSGQYWDSSANACLNNPTPPPSTYSPPPGTYTPPPYTPPPSCPSGQYWDSSANACLNNPTPPPTSSIQHQMALAYTIMSCDDSGGEWNAGSSKCRKPFWRMVGNILKIFLWRR